MNIISGGRLKAREYPACATLKCCIDDMPIDQEVSTVSIRENACDMLSTAIYTALLGSTHVKRMGTVLQPGKVGVYRPEEVRGPGYLGGPDVSFLQHGLVNRI
ncbi:hypothetical protein DVH05_014015 [Phytophthora capsici]|nr:hypothetical protein DVH05_014015 [Phytophthora capsici]